MRYQSSPFIPQERQETTKERAERQRQERRAELKYTESDEKRWAENRERVLRERQQAADSAKNISEDELILKSSLKQSKPLNELAAGKFNALKKGSTETEEIKKVQQALIDCGFDLGKSGADGDFGRATEGAVKQFQTHYKPTHTTHTSYQFDDVDGIVGKNTILALDEAAVESWRYQPKAFRFTLEMLQAVYPRVSSSKQNLLQGIVDELNDHIEFYKLDTPLRRTHFFAQIMQETGPTLNMAEYTNYRTTVLDTSQFETARERNYPADHKLHPGKRYIDVLGIDRKENGFFVKKDGTKPSEDDKRMLFNVMYGGRVDLKNGDYLTTDDGWNFRGRGLKQLTGRGNYTAFNKWHAAHQARWPDDIIDAVNHPEILLEIKYATRSAANFWLVNEVYLKADAGAEDSAINSVTKVVNSGTASYGLRRNNFKKLWEAKVFK
ncbi:peptidoglycan-binding protein [Vibrio neptunius]|uniref:Peptidoglycan-binding protein n=1 Tax=Vibrio neptunius TaxID=170651 RepID=A0ABS3A740_9VIBR|nr:peptidoglycan-binding protein [Vibrio neptunius]MBN3517512.1 peptidoglycan-binding protein [Vibrio neptunius]MBN3551849.1 peptidoglycan-binding protein [Vibrio neptunius]MBN3580300.1 peptidoglycan-binding protein [Vibrio neptunius]MCH9873966.1 peptidoglycan-binding protein [Vibrio neptunius]